MAIDNRINTTITAETMATVEEQITSIEGALSFLIGLSEDERKSVLKLGDSSVAFVGKALELAQRDPGFLPRNFNVEEMTNDVTLFNQISTLLRRIDGLRAKLDDSRLVAGAEAYAASLTVYKYAKDANVDEGLRPFIDDLARRFARKSRTTGEA